MRLSDWQPPVETKEMDRRLLERTMEIAAASKA
jgi:hypothetical protein